MTPFETILVAAIGTGLVGIGSFITWFVKLILPKIFESWDRLIKSVDSMASNIPSSLNDVKAQVSVNTIEVKEIRVAVSDLQKEVMDRRFKDLQDQIDRSHSNERASLSESKVGRHFRDGPESSLLKNNN